MKSNQKYIIAIILWGTLCLPALTLLGVIQPFIVRPLSDMFSPPHVLNIAWVLIGHAVVFLVPFLIALKYISTRTHLIGFVATGVFAIVLHYAARSVGIGMSHFFCKEYCSEPVIPWATDHALTAYLLFGFGIAIVIATGIMYLRLSPAKKPNNR